MLWIAATNYVTIYNNRLIRACFIKFSPCLIALQFIGLGAATREISGYAAIINYAARRLNPIYFSSGPKVKVKTPFILTGASLKIAGLKTHLRAASTAALRSARWPLMALASTTSPISEMVTSTLTVPVAFIFLAFG